MGSAMYIMYYYIAILVMTMKISIVAKDYGYCARYLWVGSIYCQKTAGQKRSVERAQWSLFNRMDIPQTKALLEYIGGSLEKCGKSAIDLSAFLQFVACDHRDQTFLYRVRYPPLALQLALKTTRHPFSRQKRCLRRTLRENLG